jgi:hypothetical protein
MGKKTSEARPKDSPSGKQSQVGQHKNDSRDWSPVRQDWEAFKAIKRLITGPHEHVPESFLRGSIARQLGIKPEDVTCGQINHAVVTELLPHYPAITVIPQEPAPEADKAELGELGHVGNDEKENASDRSTSVARDSQKTSNPSQEQFQIKVDAAKQLLLSDMQEVARRLTGTPISLLFRLFPDGSQQCLRAGFAQFLRIGKKFPNEIGTNPAKWARSMAAGVIIESVKGGPFEVCLQQLLSLLNGEEAKAILLQEAILEEAGREGRADARP